LIVVQINIAPRLPAILCCTDGERIARGAQSPRYIRTVARSINSLKTDDGLAELMGRDDQESIGP